MLTLTITDPNQLTPTERAALVLLFSPLAAAAPKPPKTIDAADIPSTGAAPLEIPRVTESKFEMVKAPVAAPPMPPAPPPAVLPAAPAEPALDPVALFGGNKPSVPVPPVMPAAPAAASAPPSAPAATADVPPVGVTLDSKGLPWDMRIHASTKGQNADGGWKKRKNVEPALIASVEGELRALMAVPVVPPPPPTETPTTFPMLMDWVTKMVAAHKLTQADVVTAVTPYSLQSVIGLGNRPDLVPAVHQALIDRAAQIEANAAAVTP